MEVRGRQLRLGYSQPNTRLYVGNIPKHLGVPVPATATACSLHSRSLLSSPLCLSSCCAIPCRDSSSPQFLFLFLFSERARIKLMND